jgi:hypothetical protein
MFLANVKALNDEITKITRQTEKEVRPGGQQKFLVDRFFTFYFFSSLLTWRSEQLRDGKKIIFVCFTPGKPGSNRQKTNHFAAKLFLEFPSFLLRKN